LFYTSPVPDADELETLYRNEWSVPAGQNYTHRKKFTRSWRLGQRAKKLRRLTSGDSLLEIGCGPGDFLRGARSAAFTTIVGVEPGDGEAEYTRSLGFDIYNKMFLEVDFADARFDVIVSRQVIEHVLDPIEFLSAAPPACCDRAAASCWRRPAAVTSRRASRVRTGVTCGPRGI
jgi:2-polyprenyl-3-methyl-5-hydroxy-6-metoxy-1,4-benzoquinol methylase